MKTPTDPLPEPWEWYNYQGNCWGVSLPPDKEGERSYLVWTFNPNKEGFAKNYGDVPEGTDCWIVRTNGQKGDTYDAKFSTIEEATHYIAMRAMLGTWTEKEKE